VCSSDLATFRLTPLGAFAFPLKVIEYMAAGLPVLCTRETEAEQILIRYPAGRAVAFTPEALAEATIELLTDARAYSVAQRAAAEASKVFSWERAMHDELEAIAAIPGLPIGAAAGGAR
jgi:glycosyltransferase involved in cell wall biosynthesis